MGTSLRIATLALAAAVLCPIARPADADERVRTEKCRFVRLAEMRVGGRECVAVIVKPLAGDGQKSLLVSRKQEKVLAAVRKLKGGQPIAVLYEVEQDRNWLARVEPMGEAGAKPDRPAKGEKPGRDRPRTPDRPAEARGDLRELARLLGELRAEVTAMRKELGALRAENARLRRQLGEKGVGKEPRKRPHEERRKEPRREPERGAAALPDGLRGFRGMMLGTVVRKAERSFVLRVEKITRTWQMSKAPKPAAAVGKELTFSLGGVNRLAEEHLRVLKNLKVGDRVAVGASHLKGDRLTVMEGFKKVD